MKNAQTKIGSAGRGVLASVFSHVFWGFSFLASRTALDRASVFLLLSHRFLSAFLLIHIFLLLRPSLLRLRGKRVWLLLLLGLAEPVVYFIGEQYGLLHSTTIFSGVMIAMIPIVSTLAAAPILKEKPSALQLVFSLLSVSGVVGIGLMSRNAGMLDWIGVLGLLVAVASATAYTLLSRGISAEFSPFERCYTMLGIGAVAFTAMALAECGGSPAAYLAPLGDGSYLLSLLFLSACCSVASYFLSGYALTYLSVARASVFANLTTAVSVFAGAALLHEPFSWQGGIFCLLILLGIYGVQKAGAQSSAERGGS